MNPESDWVQTLTDSGSERFNLEMSNSHMIGEIESKLPAIVKKDWIDTVLKQDLESKPSSEKFEYLMNHLSESKKKAR